MRFGMIIALAGLLNTVTAQLVAIPTTSSETETLVTGPRVVVPAAGTCNFKLCTSSDAEVTAFYKSPRHGVYGGIFKTNPLARKARESCHSTAAGRDQLWPICDAADPCEHGTMYSWTSSGCTQACEEYNVSKQGNVEYNDWSLKTGKYQGESSKGVKAWA